MQGSRLHLARMQNRDEFLPFDPRPRNPLIYLANDRHVTGHPSTEYISDETPMAAYANVHIALEQMRVRALRAIHGSPAPEDEHNAKTEPPRVLVLGPENSGKTTVCKILTNYAVRSGQDWSPMLINVDSNEVRVLPFMPIPNRLHNDVDSPLTGRLVSARRNICCRRSGASPYKLARKSTRFCCDISTRRSLVQRAGSDSLLVWSCRDQKKPTPPRQNHS